ncbi:hypothetical protein MKW92_028066 [Papaver armeniacum]|nr:hypothetical protein MKW92_028066 [Papaver armeniacum]
MEKSIHQRRGKRRLPPSPKVAPWLVFPHGKDGKYHSFYNICNDADEKLKKRSLNKFLPELSKKSFRQKNCHQGWLIVLSDDTTDPNYGDCLLWNPQTLDTIQLPSILCYYETKDKYWLKDCILTSPPQMNTSSSNSSSDGDNYDKDSMVYLLFDGGHNNVGCTDLLLFCHPGEKEWRRHELNGSHDPRCMLYLKNKLHIMCFNPVYYVIEVQGGSAMDDDETLAVGAEVIIGTDNIVVTESIGGYNLGFCRPYFLESFGEVFRIRYSFIRRGIYLNNVRSIEILKLDFSSMAWENVKSLEDHVFFMSYGTQLSCLASDLGFSEGCLYYTQKEEMSLYKYDLEDQSILLSVPCPDLPTPWFRPDWLMITTTPTPRVDVKRQAADCILGKVEHMNKIIKVTENFARVAWDDEKDDSEEERPGILASDDLTRLMNICLVFGVWFNKKTELIMVINFDKDY